MTQKRNNYLQLRKQRPVAWLLLLFAGVMIGIPHCVLPPPPQVEPDVPTPIFLNLDLIKPVGPGPVLLERAITSQVLFSVASALLNGPNLDLNYYWFIDFDVNNPKQADSTEEDFLLEGCHGSLVDNSGAAKTATLEVLITEGVLAFIFDDNDPRDTLGGEPIDSVRWTIIVSGVPDCAQGPPNDLL
jgi:hypothetical protein